MPGPAGADEDVIEGENLPENGVGVGSKPVISLSMDG
jgi:hypothetical protein